MSNVSNKQKKKNYEENFFNNDCLVIPIFEFQLKHFCPYNDT